MLILRIDDVGRLSTDPPEQGSDGNLDYFAEWRKQCGLEGLPVVYGVVPMWIGAMGYDWLRANSESIAIHGYNHKKGEVVSRQQMRWAREYLGSDSYIAPFNEYTGNTLVDWELEGGKYFFGGFNGEHHHCGLKPKRIRSLIHLSAAHNLYGRAKDIINNFPEIPVPYPRVMTLHVPWETQPSHVAKLVGRVRHLLVPLEVVSEYLKGENRNNPLNDPQDKEAGELLRELTEKKIEEGTSDGGTRGL